MIPVCNQLIGRSETASVYSACSDGARVAVKVRNVSDIYQRQKFVREVVALLRLKHPHILQLRSYVFEKQMAYIVMPLAEGSLSSAYSLAYESIPLWQGVAQLCSALEYLHAMGLVHRDIKPENILVMADPPRLCLSDFDSAVGVRGEECPLYEVATAPYRAPELFAGTSYTQAIDFWSLACVLYYWESGKALFGGNTSLDIVRAQIQLLGSASEVFTEASGSEAAVLYHESSRLFHLLTASEVAECLARWHAAPHLASAIAAFLSWQPERRHLGYAIVERDSKGLYASIEIGSLQQHEGTETPSRDIPVCHPSCAMPELTPQTISAALHLSKNQGPEYSALALYIANLYWEPHPVDEDVFESIGLSFPEHSTSKIVELLDQLSQEPFSCNNGDSKRRDKQHAESSSQLSSSGQPGLQLCYRRT